MPEKSPYDIGAIFEAMTIDLINSLKRNFTRHKAEEIREGFRWEQWQRSKLRNLIAYRRRNRKIVTTTIIQAEKLVDDVLIDSFREGEARVKLPKDFPIRGDIGDSTAHRKLPKAPKETAFFGMNERKLEALQETVKNDLGKAQQGVQRKMDDVYRQTIYKAEVNMASGAKTLGQAIDMATKDFLSKGVNTIEYADGRKVSITAYAEMALRTAAQRATFLGEGKKRDEFGVYTVLMSAHDNCSPMCLPYQGTVMIDDVYTSITKEKAQELAKEGKYQLLSVAMENHAFHPNCRHSLATFFPGINSIPEPVDDEKAVANYETQQHQRYLERGIRMYKRLHEGSVDEVNQLRYKKKVDEWEGRLKDHLKGHDQLRRDRKREVG